MEQVRVWFNAPLIHWPLADILGGTGFIAVRRQRIYEPRRRTSRNAL